MPLTPGGDDTTVIPAPGEPGFIKAPADPNKSTAQVSASATSEWPWYYWAIGAYLLMKVMKRR